MTKSDLAFIGELQGLINKYQDFVSEEEMAVYLSASAGGIIEKIDCYDHQRYVVTVCDENIVRPFRERQHTT